MADYKNQKFYWFLIVYMLQAKNGDIVFTSKIINNTKKRLTKKLLEGNENNMTAIINISYLGYMTEPEYIKSHF